MAITALDIKDKQFTTKFRGYNEQEVDEFLDIIVDDYEDLVRDNEDERLRNGLISPSTISQWFSKSIQEGVRGGNWWDENDKAGYWRIRLVPLLITGI